jgi:hypothetical protein
LRRLLRANLGLGEPKYRRRRVGYSGH